VHGCRHRHRRRRRHEGRHRCVCEQEIDKILARKFTNKSAKCGAGVHNKERAGSAVSE
jgi:hypothetical protein